MAPAAAVGRCGPRAIRVLLVDDEPLVTAALASGLRRQRFEIQCANSVKEALRILAAAEFDVVVSDERMPGTSGCKFLALVRRQWPTTMRVMLSGHADLRATLDAINQAHVFRFLTKPCSSDDVAFCIRQAAAAKEQMIAVDPAAAAADRSPADLDRFRGALELLWMAYQPVVDARTEAIVAYEALLRCDDPGFASADELLKHAERLDLIAVLDHAARTIIAADLARIPDGVLVQANVHARTLLDERLYTDAVELGLRSDRITIELTEREDLSTLPDLAERVARLRAVGYRIAVDDLGGGWAGLATFATVVPDVVKFGMELVRGIHRSPTKAKIVQSLVALCRELKITTVAEGIETAEERRCAIELGCDQLQGYSIGRPVRLAR